MDSRKEETNPPKVEQSKLESEWVTAIKSDDKAAFEKLFNNYCQRLINFTRRYVIDKQIAENIVQDVFVNVWQRRSNLDPEKSIKTYLFTASRNEGLKHLRHLNVEKKSFDRIIESYPEAKHDLELEGKEISQSINKAINELPEKCREIFELNRFENLKYAEIAYTLNISVKTVETQMGRALKKLRKQLKPLLPMLLFLLIARSIKKLPE